MRNAIFFFLLLLGSVVQLTAQTTQRTQVEYTFEREVAATVQEGLLPYPDQLPFFTYFAEWTGGPLAVSMRFADANGQWTEWETLPRDSHNREKAITHLQVGQLHWRRYQVRIDSRNAQTESLQLHFFQPDETPPTSTVWTGEEEESSPACPCPLPPVQGRSDWCPSGDCPEDATPVATEVTHLIVHHSAGTNVASDWAAIVRAVWDLHVNGNGWDDIGYNYLVDPNGVIYEGRGNNRLGAHFCGSNTGTMGTCVLGNFTNDPPTEEAVAALQRLLAWKTCDIGADPLGQSFHSSSSQTLFHISGHRDGCATACPGDAFYPQLPALRAGTQNEILANCSGLAAPINLDATEINPTSYFLAWNHSSPDEEGFLLERSENQGDSYNLLADLDANTLSYVESDLELERLYYYRIRAYSEADTSLYSNVAIINTGVVGTHTISLPSSALTLAPNPAQDRVQLRFQHAVRGPLVYSLYNTQGQVVQQAELTKDAVAWEHTLDISALPSGVYSLRLRVKEWQGIWRVVKL